MSELLFESSRPIEDIEKDFEGKFWGNKDWCVVIFPVILAIISLIIMALIGNYLYR